MNNREHIENLIAKHFAGEANAEEERQIALWLEESEANKKYFVSLENIYIKSAIVRDIKEVDTDAAWNKVKAGIDNAGKNKGMQRSFQSGILLRIAAMILLVAGIGSVIYIMQKEDVAPVFVESGMEAREVILPDSSSAYLNKGSSIEYSYSAEGRHITMSGEVYFDVKHSDIDFIVEANGLIVKDIGTAFNINARDKEKVEVLVTDGEVIMQAKGVQPVNLTEGEHSVYNKAVNTITELSVADPNTLSYKTKIFVFENASLPAVVEKINEVYGTSVSISDNLKYCRITSTFKNESVDTILQVIAEVLQLRIVKLEKQIILEGPSCE